MKTLVEVAKEYQIDYASVYQKFNRNISRLEGHYEIVNGKRYVDEYAEKILKPKTSRVLLSMQEEKYKEEIKKIREEYEEKIKESKNETNKIREELEGKSEAASGELYWANQNIKELTQRVNEYEVMVRDKNDEIRKLKMQIEEMQERIAEYEKMEQDLEKNISKKGLFR